MPWSPSIELVTLAQAKQHLKLPLDVEAEDADLELKLEIAHELVMDYLANRLEDEDEWEEEIEGWTAATAPKRVLGAILYEFARMYRFRGDDGDARNEPTLSGASRLLLDRFRDPSVS